MKSRINFSMPQYKFFFSFSFVLLFAAQVFSQIVDRVHVDLSWYEREVLVDPVNNKYQRVATFKNGQIKMGQADVTLFRSNAEVISNSKLSAELTNLKVEIVDAPLYSSSYHSNFEIKTYVNSAREEYVGGFVLNPIRNINGVIERIVSCDVVLSQEPKELTSVRGPERTYESILKEGDIYKISVDEPGVYMLDKRALEDLGVDVGSINIKNLGIYSNYGGVLPELIRNQHPDDLIEIPILVDGESDGTFDNGDAIYFYLDGPDRWEFEDVYTYNTNIYDTKNYAYIIVNDKAGKRINSATPANAPEIISEAYDHLQIWNDEQNNLLADNTSTEGSGQTWFGERIEPGANINLSDKFDFTNLEEPRVTMYGAFASRSGSSSTTEIKLGEEEIITKYDKVSLNSIESNYASLKSFNRSFELIGQPDLSLSYSANSGSNGWLDFIQIETRKKFTNQDEVFFFQDKRDENVSTFSFQVGNSLNGLTIWDVTDLSSVLSHDADGGNISYTTDSVHHTFVAFNKSNSKRPALIGQIENQNIHGIDDIDMVVVYPSIFKAQVDKFVEHRSTYSNYDVLSVNVEDIYQEFSSGRRDATAIRDFAKMLLDRNLKFKYMLLFGDGSYDHRGIEPDLNDERFIPVYETHNSINPIRAFPSDDYYALLSDEEGESLDGALDLGVGRLTVRTPEEAEAVVNKIIQYDTSPDRFGDWRLRATYTADDEDSNTHLRQMDGIANEVLKNFPQMNDQKIYFDTYRQESTPGGERYPEVEEAFDRAMDRGHLVFCYLGHGGPKGWAQERVLKSADIKSWDNINQQTLIVSATCSFTGYDDPSVQSAGEDALLNGKGGTVALFTTVRAVYASENERLTSEVFENIFKKDQDGLPLTFGDAITISKNSNSQDTSGENSRKFSLIGDPSQRIALPRYDITVDLINGQSIDTYSDTVGALDEVVISGQIVDNKGKLMPDFNGVIFPTIFDKRTTIETLRNDAESRFQKIDVMKNIIFKGQASVTNGQYEFSFIIPKDIIYSVGKGKISLYATDGTERDAAGFYNDMLIGGSSNVTSNDEGPEVELFMNDERFVSGDVVAPNSTLLVNLEDDLGINVTGASIGHDLTATLDGPVEGNFVLNEFYEASLNDFKSGKVSFPFRDLIEGKYTITVKAWDISNNSTEATIEFEVREDDGNGVSEVLNFPNPFTQETRFVFKHNLGSTDADVTINFYTTVGQLVHSYNEVRFLSGNKEEVILNDLGDKLLNGVYLYKINMNARTLGISRESKFHKMVKMD